MDSNEKLTLGDYLKQARKDKGVTIDEISRETNISKRYLSALEENDYSLFPADTYILGFLTTYAEALEVDRDFITQQFYKQMRIEQDAPLEQLVGLQKRTPVKINMGVVGAIIGGGLLLLLIIIAIATGKPREGGTTTNQPAKNYVYAADQLAGVSEQRFVIGDTITITNNVRSITIKLLRLGPSKNLEFQINRQNYSLKEGEVLNIDTDNNNIDDLGMEVFGLQNNQIKLSIAVLQEQQRVVQTNNLLSSEYQDAVISETEIISYDSKTPVAMKIKCSASGWIGYIADSGEIKELVVKKDQVVDITFTDKLVLMLGNAGAVQIQVGDKVENGGSWGEVNKSVFYWRQANGRYTLIRALLK